MHPGKTRQPCLPRISSYRMLVLTASLPVSVRSVRRLTYRCAGEFVSELMAAWNTDWSMTCCIITRSSRPLVLLQLLLLLLLLPSANTDADECTSRTRLQMQRS